MFKVILSSVMVLGLGSVAYAADPAGGAPPAEPTMDMPKGETPTTPPPASKMDKKKHGGHHHDKMDKDAPKKDGM